MNNYGVAPRGSILNRDDGEAAFRNSSFFIIHSSLEPGTMLSHGNTRRLQSNKGNRNKSVTMINYYDKGKHRLI